MDKRQFSDVTFWEHAASEIVPGLEFYLVEVHFENTGQTRLDAQARPGKTNMGRQELVNGYLGSTDNVGQYGWGHWRLVSAWPRGMERYDIEVEEIDQEEH